MFRIFISSVQKEFENERVALGEFIEGDALLRRHFTTFIFERDIPAQDRAADDVYLDELANSDLYIGLLGDEYGWENDDGLSPTHLEFNEATRRAIPRLIYVHGSQDSDKHPKMRALIRDAGNQLIRRRFDSFDDLRANTFTSLVDHLETTGVIVNTPWDATPAPRASIGDIDTEALRRFVATARKGRNFPLNEDAAPADVLSKLNLLDKDSPTQGAVLLFGREPQRFLPAAIIKCAHFHGTEVAKPIPAHLDVKGTAFDQVDAAVDFVLSKINVSVGTREDSAQAPVEYEIPREAIREAIVNAVAHRDYTSNASVQVSLFTDRLEIWNPGNLPPALTLELLRTEHRSFPRNLLFAEALYLARYIERYGTGTGDMIRRCAEAGLPEPDFQLTDGFVTILQRPTSPSGPSRDQEAQAGTKSTLSDLVPKTKRFKAQEAQEAQVVLTPVEIAILQSSLATPLSSRELLEVAGYKTRTGNFKRSLEKLLEWTLLEMTLPDKPTSSKQQYRTTETGRRLLEQQKGQRR